MALGLYLLQQHIENTIINSNIENLFESQSRLRLRSQSLFGDIINNILAKIENILNKKYRKNEVVESVWSAYFNYCLNWAATDWFKESAENPKLTRPKTLSTEFNLHNKHGIPHTTQQRENWVALQQWAKKDTNILTWLFKPNELTSNEEQELRKELQRLRTREWPPFHFLDAYLKHWHTDEPTRDWNLKISEKKLLKICKEFIAKYENK